MHNVILSFSCGRERRFYSLFIFFLRKATHCTWLHEAARTGQGDLVPVERNALHMGSSWERRLGYGRRLVVHEITHKPTRTSPLLLVLAAPQPHWEKDSTVPLQCLAHVLQFLARLLAASNKHYHRTAAHLLVGSVRFAIPVRPCLVPRAKFFALESY